MRQTHRHMVMVMISALLLAVTAALASLLTRKAHDRLQQSVQREAMALTGISAIPRGQELFVVRQALASDAERYTVFQQWMEPGAYRLFDRIARTADGRGMSLDVLSVRPQAILIRGTGGDWNDPDLLTQQLPRTEWKIEVERNDAGADERVHFVVRAQR